MAVTLHWPVDLIPNENTLLPESNSKAFQSPFSGSTQTVGYPGTHWKMTLTFNRLLEEKRRKLEVIIAQLDGQSGRVWLWDFKANLVSSPQPVLGFPVVTIALSMGTIFQSRGWESNKRILKLGDWIQVGDELKLVTADIYSDMSGQAAISIAPMLRNNYENGTPLIVGRPCGKFMLSDNNQGESRRKSSSGSMSVSFVEAFYP